VWAPLEARVRERAEELARERRADEYERERFTRVPVAAPASRGA
jgi:hypothetical protein